MTVTDTEQLQARLNARDMKGAATFLVQHYADDVYGLCRAMMRDDALAEDLSQDVFGKALAALASFRGDASPRTWILRIARNACIDSLRSQQRAPWADAEDVDPEEEASDAIAVDDLLARHDDVQRGLSSLDERERALVMLRFGHELSYAELGSTFGLGEGAVRMRVSRAVAKMRKAIDMPPILQDSLSVGGDLSYGSPAAPLPPPLEVSAPVPLSLEEAGDYDEEASLPPLPAQSAPAPRAKKRSRSFRWPFSKKSKADATETPVPRKARANLGGSGSVARSRKGKATAQSPFASRATSALLNGLNDLIKAMY